MIHKSLLSVLCKHHPFLLQEDILPSSAMKMPPESSKCKISPLGKDIVDCQTDDSRSMSKETKKGEKMISIEGTFVHNKKGNTKGVKEELISTNYSYLRTIVRYSI